ncbi:sigma-70 family RNA polymerase sigma factor [Undibacterium sp.]|uniref:sigma-70 family RNA polymerase sigma factor n=1 Tax=Undibacterium sp. TaxID=1914977 RepID=UPI0025E4038C|nr:sigma-70 family RNA polymerase sigma factor [Undibacterium sp.]
MTSIPELHQQLESMRPALFRFAMLQLRNEAQAEDAVQEALLAILEKPDSFAGASSLRTYVTGILKYKIIDCLRAAGKEKQLPIEDEESEADLIDSLFKKNGHTVETARAWGEPDASLSQKDFFRILEICLEKLPAKTARVFMMREWLELETEEICKELDLSTSNLWVLLFRARLRLRECLDLNWFANKA